MYQPKWRFVENLGDAQPVENGGFFVYRDTTGVYEVEKLEEPSDDIKIEKAKRCLSRFKTLHDPVDQEGLLVTEEWFYKDLESVAAAMDTKKELLVAAFCSGDWDERAWAWRCVGDYHGYDNLDSSPSSLTRSEVLKRYRNILHPRKKTPKPSALLALLVPFLCSLACDPQIRAVDESPTTTEQADLGTSGDLSSASTSCAAGSMLCPIGPESYACVDVQSSADNCGACGVHTDPNRPDCCAGKLTNLHNYTDNCGACGVQCEHGDYCRDGLCVGGGR